MWFPKFPQISDVESFASNFHSLDTLELLHNLLEMTCSVLGFKKRFSSFQQLTRLIFRLLAGENAAFHQLTDPTILLRAGENSDYAQKTSFHFQNFDSIQLSVSPAYQQRLERVSSSQGGISVFFFVSAFLSAL